MIDEGKLNFSDSGKRIFDMLCNPDSNASALELAERFNLLNTDDSSEIEMLMTKAMEKYPDKVNAYKNGNQNLLGLFIGEVKRNSNKNFDMKILSKVVKETLEK